MVAGRVLLVRRVRVDRGHQCPRLRVRFLSGVDRASLEAAVVGAVAVAVVGSVAHG
ncbi:hypothetical protein BN903_33 [Halorubrum sp. AJ67]|nr:hypothetical protein BN903_33 [Halorubrum sp. AJ67]